MPQAPIPIGDHATDNLRFIRAAMERASAFTSIPGWGGVGVGVTATIAAVVAGNASTLRQWLIVWLIEAVVAAPIGFGAMAVKARRSQEAFMSGVARRFFISYFAPLIAGAILTLALVRVESYSAIPSLWLLLYGTAFVSSGAFSIRVVPLMGIGFMFLGLVASLVPFGAANVLLGVGFGGLHIAFGLIIARSYGG